MFKGSDYAYRTFQERAGEEREGESLVMSTSLTNDWLAPRRTVEQDAAWKQLVNEVAKRLMLRCNSEKGEGVKATYRWSYTGMDKLHFFVPHTMEPTFEKTVEELENIYSIRIQVREVPHGPPSPHGTWYDLSIPYSELARKGVGFEILLALGIMLLLLVALTWHFRQL